MSQIYFNAFSSCSPVLIITQMQPSSWNVYHVSRTDMHYIYFPIPIPIIYIFPFWKSYFAQPFPWQIYYRDPTIGLTKFLNTDGIQLYIYCIYYQFDNIANSGKGTVDGLNWMFQGDIKKWWTWGQMQFSHFAIWKAAADTGETFPLKYQWSLSSQWCLKKKWKKSSNNKK